ncbi:MAG: hypothetical protein ACE5EU_01555 [Paracoccaceae bacterium]
MPFSYTAGAYAGLIREGHHAGIEIGYCHVGKLPRLEVLPPAGHEIACFPWKIKGASVGFTRAVAVFEE